MTADSRTTTRESPPAVAGSEAGETSNYGFEDWLRGWVRTAAVEVRAEDRPAPGGKHFNPSIVYHKKIAIEVLDPKPGDRILDLGCATGATTVYCAMAGATCVGVDLSLKAVRQGHDYLRQHGMRNGALFIANAGVLPFADESFDKAVSCDLYEHLDDRTKERVLSEARRILRPGGTLVLKTPNLSYLRLSVSFKRVRALLRLQNPFKLVIPHTPRADGPNAEHIGLTTIARIERDLHRAGFFSCDFYYGLSTKLTFLAPSVNRVLHKEIPVLRDCIVEEIVVKAAKSRLADLIPD